MKPFFVFFTVFAVMTTARASSQVLSGDENRIRAVSVSGLKRTKPHIIEKPLQRFVGMDAGSVDPHEVFAIVKSIGVLEPLSVEITDNQGGKTLAVTVREKWAVFPLPLLSVSSSGWLAGGVLLDANAFGVKDTLLAMGMGGPEGLSAAAMYLNTPDSAGEFGWSIMGWFSSREIKDTDQTGKQTLRKYKATTIRPAIGLSYQIAEHIASNVSLSYRHVALQDAENPINAPEKGAQGITLSPELSIRWSDWDGYLLNENHALLKYDCTFTFDGGHTHSLSLNAVCHHSVIPGFRVFAKGGAVFSSASADPFFTPPMNNVVNILAMSYSPTSFAGASLGLETHLCTVSLGTVTLSFAYQAVYSHGDVSPHQADHGAAASLQLYFSGIALPAVGLGGSYNAARNVWQYTLNIGLSF
jgi:hypothetical protein